MKLSNIEMSNYLLYLRNVSRKVTGKLAYAISRNMRKLSNEVLEFETIRNNLIEKYGTKNEDGNFVIKIASEQYKNFEEEISEYTDIEHEVDIYMIDPEIFDSSILNAEEISQLDFMISE